MRRINGMLDYDINCVKPILHILIADRAIPRFVLSESEEEWKAMEMKQRSWFDELMML